MMIEKLIEVIVRRLRQMDEAKVRAVLVFVMNLR